MPAVWRLRAREGSPGGALLTVLYESREARDTAVKTRMTEGVAMGYDRLAEMLAAGSL